MKDMWSDTQHVDNMWSDFKIWRDTHMKVYHPSKPVQVVRGMCMLSARLRWLLVKSLSGSLHTEASDELQDV